VPGAEPLYRLITTLLDPVARGGWPNSDRAISGESA
jgi:hypothetical protein